MAGQLTDLDIGETSGVDHPAHLNEGWMLMKSKDGLAARVAQVLKDSSQECPECGASVPAGDKHCPECGATMPDMEKSVASVDRLRQLHAVIGELIGEGGEMSEAQEEPVEKAEEVLEAEASPDTEEEVLKSLDPTVREFITKERDRADRLEKALNLEVETRENKAAIAKARDWKDIGIDADEFGPALRKMRAWDADIAALVEKALDGAKTVQDTSKVFETIGKATTGTSDQLETMTREVMAKNADLNYAAAQAQVLETPEGAAAYERAVKGA